MRGPWHTTWSEEIPPQLLCQGDKCKNRPQTIGGIGQQRQHNTVTVATAHNAA